MAARRPMGPPPTTSGAGAIMVESHLIELPPEERVDEDVEDWQDGRRVAAAAAGGGEASDDDGVAERPHEPSKPAALVRFGPCSHSPCAPCLPPRASRVRGTRALP